MDTPTSPMAPLRFHLPEALLISAARQNAARYNLRFLMFALIVGVLTSLYFAFQYSPRPLTQILINSSIIVLGAMVMAVVVLMLIRYLLMPMQVRKAMRQQKQLLEEMQLSWTQEEFVYTTGKSQTVMAFRSLHGFKIADDVILLYHSDVLYHLVPTAALAEASRLDAFATRLSEAGIKRL